MEEATELAKQFTNGQGADQAIVTVGIIKPEYVGQAMASIRKAGTVVVTALGNIADTTPIPSRSPTSRCSRSASRARCSAMSNPNWDILRQLELYRDGVLKLDELITKTYTLDEIQQGYQDMHDGKNIRGVSSTTSDRPRPHSASAPAHASREDHVELTPVVGLRREREVLTVALATGRHVVLEGPPGTGKSTLLRSIAADTGQEVVFVEGNAELTPARLIGQFDPSQVLAEGYRPEHFVDGPLITACARAALLYMEELNRVPEETLNVLITVLTEGEIAVPRLGRCPRARTSG